MLRAEIRVFVGPDTAGLIELIPICILKGLPSDNCSVYWEENLGCALIKSTLGPGNPGGGGLRARGEGRYKEAMGDKGIVYEQPGTEVDDSYHCWRVPSK